jgi:hypothetical protein
VTPQREHAARLLERAGLLHGSATQAHSKFSQSGVLGSPPPPRRGSSRGCWCCRHRCLLSKTAIVLREHGRAPLRKVTREDPISRLVVLVLDKVLHEPSLRAVLTLDRLRYFQALANAGRAQPLDGIAMHAQAFAMMQARFVVAARAELKRRQQGAQSDA